MGGVTLPADHTPLRQSEFLGLWNRGLTDNAPDRYFSDCLNIKYVNGEDASTRDGLALGVTKSNIVRSWVYKRLGETPRQIILDSFGNLVDSLTPGTPIWIDASIVDFSLTNYANRAYITVHNRISGIPGKYVLVYQGSGTARLAAGSAPTGFTLGAGNSAVVGNCEAGYHLLAICGLTDTGFITAPGTTGSCIALLNCPGGLSIDLSNIPTLVGSQWVGRVILATKAIPISLYNGDTLGYEFFFVPNGTINDNTTTAKTISFFDADLSSSADYLLDNLAQIPAGVGIGVYQNRLVTWGENQNQFTVRISKQGFPENFSSISGFVNLDPSDAQSGVKNCSEARGKQFLICTSNRMYSTSDNGSDPNTWAVPQRIDTAVGTECFGIATVDDTRSVNTDRLFIATYAGLQYYDGILRKPELSFNIEGLWARINKKYFNLVQVIDDPKNHRVFVTVPLDSATAVSHVLYADYSKAHTIYGTLDERVVKWSVWSFVTPPVSIAGDLDVNNVPILHVALTNNIYDLKPGLTDDFGNAIDSFVITSLKTASAGWINHFGGIKLRIKGSGILQITAYGEDASNPTVCLPINLSAAPGMEFDRLINFINEKCAIKLRTNLFGEYFILNEFTIWGKPVWLRRPQ